MDATGKAVGRRVLDDHGNWISIKELSQEVQEEISIANKAAGMERRDKALANNAEYVKNKDAIDAKKLKEENDGLKSVVTQQNDMLAKFADRLDKAEAAVASVVVEPVVAPLSVVKAAEVVAKPIVPAKPKKLSEKQRVIAKLEEADVEFDETETTAVLKAKLKEYNDSF